MILESNAHMVIKCHVVLGNCSLLNMKSFQHSVLVNSRGRTAVPHLRNYVASDTHDKTGAFRRLFFVFLFMKTG